MQLSVVVVARNMGRSVTSYDHECACARAYWRLSFWLFGHRIFRNMYVLKPISIISDSVAARTGSE